MAEVGASRLNFDIFKMKQEKIFVYIPITLCTDFCALIVFEWSKINNFMKKVLNTKLKNILSYISI